MRRVLFLLPAPLLLLSACRSTTAEFLREQEGFVAHSGFVLKTTMNAPAVKKLKDGTAYTCRNEGDSVVIYNEERTRFGTRRNRRTFELKPGDVFVNSRPLSFVLIRR